MPTEMKWRQKDPNGLGRGSGWYYLRGGKRSGKFTLPSGETFNGPYYSKYSREVDKQTASTGAKFHPVGVPKNLANKYAHVTDGQLKNNPRIPGSFSKPKRKKK